jgi:prevent-host-death family protein
MSRTISIEEAEARFESLIDEVAAGEEYLITRDGRPVARIVPVHIGFGPYEPKASERGEAR